MANYRYELRESSGQIRVGLIEANSTTDAAQILRARGGYILSLMEISKAGKRGLQNILAFKVQTGPTARDVLNFTRQLAIIKPV